MQCCVVPICDAVGLNVGVRETVCEKLPPGVTAWLLVIAWLGVSVEVPVSELRWLFVGELVCDFVDAGLVVIEEDGVAAELPVSVGETD